MIDGNDSLPLLIVEDSDEDYDVLTLTFQQAQIPNELLRCSEGAEVVRLLDARRTANQALPGLILLDLNLIGVDGREVLKRLKRDPVYRRIPVIVFSTSSSPRDVESCYAEGAACYTVKPVSYERLEKFVANLKAFWLNGAILPREMPLERWRNQNG